VDVCTSIGGDCVIYERNCKFRSATFSYFLKETSSLVKVSLEEKWGTADASVGYFERITNSASCRQFKTVAMIRLCYELLLLHIPRHIAIPPAIYSGRNRQMYLQ